MSKKITQLPAQAHPVDGTELMEMVQDGVSVKVPTSGLLINSASFVMTVDQSSVFPQSRRLVAGANVTLTDGGAGSTLEIAASGGGGNSFGDSWDWVTDQNTLNFISPLLARTWLTIVDDSFEVDIVFRSDTITLETAGTTTLVLGTASTLTTDTFNVIATTDINLTADAITGNLALSAGNVGVFTGDLALNLSTLHLNSNEGTAGQVITSQGPGLAPVWGAGGFQILSKNGGFSTVIGGAGSGLIMTFDGSTIGTSDYYILRGSLNIFTTAGAPTITVIVGGTNTGTFTLPAGGALVEFESIGRRDAGDGGVWQQLLFTTTAVTGAFGAFAAVTGNIRPISLTTKAFATPLTIEFRNATGGSTATAGVFGGFLAKF